MHSNHYQSGELNVTISRGDSSIGLFGVFLVLCLAAPWFAPTIGLAYYLSEILDWHSLAVAIATFAAFCLNYVLLHAFIKKLPTLFVLIGAAEVGAWAYWFLGAEFNPDIYWHVFLTLLAAFFGSLLFSVVVLKVKSD
ncbi:MAG: hypothetical protein JJ850_09325 [Kordiimonadaceae bacterium]|nr:hypothetical protein [Kordiimonadaceae bacterium]MBO6569332.1 hypothetical protein [Kordiimonadaceae bacterium]MBO6964807.1 hypothetical protein [Kordiimonadaceae bacterium]